MFVVEAVEGGLRSFPTLYIFTLVIFFRNYPFLEKSGGGLPRVFCRIVIIKFFDFHEISLELSSFRSLLWASSFSFYTWGFSDYMGIRFNLMS